MVFIVVSIIIALVDDTLLAAACLSVNILSVLYFHYIVFFGD